MGEILKKQIGYNRKLKQNDRIIHAGGSEAKERRWMKTKKRRVENEDGEIKFKRGE